MKTKLKNLFTMLFLIVIASKIYAQPNVMLLKKNSPLMGISKTMLYETIIKTDLKAKDLIEKTKDVLIDARLIDEKDIKLDKIDNNLKQFTLSLALKNGYYYGKGMFGVKIMQPPVILNFDANLKFDDMGNLAISFTNFREEIFYPIKDDKYAISDIDPEILGIKAETQMNNSLLGKVFLFMGSSTKTSSLMEDIAAYKKTRQNIFEELDKQYVVINNSVQKRTGKWFSDPMELLSYYPNTNLGEAQKKGLANYFNENLLIAVTNDRWQKYFEDYFNGTMIETASKINGTIIGVNRDGERVYDFKDGKLIKVKK